jgi:phosphoribosylformylglycinamidine cyclo-ligase
MSQAYTKSGVSLDRGYEAVNRMKKHIEKTKTKGVIDTIGGFGGLFDLSEFHIKEPVLVSGTDGVGTKLLIAQMMNKHDTIGIDLVAMCVNDIITIGAKPLFFLDYIATQQIDPIHIESLIKGITDGCIMSNCALIGGETAEMNDLYQKGDYDLAGYVTGVVEKSKMIRKENVKEGDILIGLKSSGIHSNGYSLVRKIFFKDHHYDITHQFDELSMTLGEELLIPTKIYVKEIVDLVEKVKVKGIAHITGGGFIENIPRMLPDGLGVEIDEKSLPKLPIFDVLETCGSIDHMDMYNIFNMGIGMVVVVSPNDVVQSLGILKDHDSRVIGLVNTSGRVVIKP